ncbi:MAG: hypothetical protein B7Z73_04405 [Planctomycetia bacterium 21-64-5]|nr:MAG: hypothetical protein B7Z73_04405 [Planctomycetia bacterium 21-64-5]
MKSAMFGAVVGAGLVVFAVRGPSLSGEAWAQRSGAQEASQSGDLIAISSAAGEQGQSAQQITIIDPKTRVMAVYHVMAADGKIELKAVRKFDWDLQMEEFNATSPLPREVRSQMTPNFHQR